MGVSGVPLMIIVVEVLPGIVLSVGLMFMSVKLLGHPSYGGHEE